MAGTYDLWIEGKVFQMKDEDEDKYIVVCCAKNENDYIIEFVEHYFKLGFDKIMIADNNEIGDDSLSKTLSEYVNDGRVEIFDLRGMKLFMANFYSMFSREGNYKWAFYCDCDEFLEFNGYDNVKDFLSTKENVNAIDINWVTYCNNGLIVKDNGGVQERFNYPIPLICRENLQRKSLLNGNFKTVYGIHTYADNPCPYEVFPSYREAYLKHYKHKSIEEQLAVVNRGSGCNTSYVSPVHFLPEAKSYHDMLLKIHDLRYYNAGHKDFDKNYEVYSFRANDMPGVLRAEFDMVCDMMATTGKYFCLETKMDIPDYMFNLLFEYALHTGNKFCIGLPNIHGGNFNFLYWPY